MTFYHYFGAALILLLVTVICLYSGKRVKSSEDFSSGGRNAGIGIVVGSIAGTLIGGSSTIGTAQLAYSYGFSAWWFTLGGGIGCLILGIFFAKPLYNSGISTISQVISREYGRNASMLSTVLMCLGSFLSIVAQLLAGIALISQVIDIGTFGSAMLIVLLMMAYVIFGGVWGAGLAGIAKMILLYVSVGLCGVIALNLGGGISAFQAVLPSKQYFNMLARGPFIDIGAVISLILGILTTQSYIQAVISARCLKTSRRGALISAALFPPIGLAGIFIGMYMKINFPNISPASALPMFVMQHVSPVLAGAAMATLLITLVGSGAGLTLGLSSMLSNDIYKVYFNKKADDRTMLIVMRIMIAAILFVSVLFTMGNIGSMILNWSFMSLGLRGAVAFAPLFGALFLPGRINKKFALAAIILGPLSVLTGKVFLPPYIDSLFLGVAISVLVMLTGFFYK